MVLDLSHCQVLISKRFPRETRTNYDYRPASIIVHLKKALPNHYINLAAHVTLATNGLTTY